MVTWILLKPVGAVIGLRVKKKQKKGLDQALHAEEAYT